MRAASLSKDLRYDAPGHSDCASYRLQTMDVGGAGHVSVGVSYFLPGGGAEMSASDAEKVYLVIDGEVTVITQDGEVTLGPLDSCRISAGEARRVENRGQQVATMAVVMPFRDVS